MALAHPFRWSYDGKGLHEKAVIRFTDMLKHASNKLEIPTLTKQLCLMTNLFEHFFDEVPKNNWDKLFDVLQSQKSTLKNSIMNEKGPIKKEKAENGLNSLLSVLEDYIWQNMQNAA
jgi:hypothetical protein